MGKGRFLFLSVYGLLIGGGFLSLVLDFRIAWGCGITERLKWELIPCVGAVAFYLITALWYKFNIRNRNYLKLVMLAGAAAYVVIVALTWSGLWDVLKLLPLSLAYFYAVPYTYKGKLGTLRQVPFAKLCIISFCWACLVVGYGSSHCNQVNAAHIAVALNWLFVFLYIAQAALLVDYADIYTDKEKGLKTIPSVLGVSGTRAFMAGLGLLTAGLAWAEPQHIFINYAFSGVLLIVICLLPPKAFNTSWKKLMIELSLFLPLVLRLIMS